MLTSGAGSVVASYGYGAYGAQTLANGTVDTALRWAGQLQDASGLYYLRARDFDPATGQFLTRDPADLITREPYRYAGDNPINLTDRTGLWFGLDDLIATGIGAIVGGGSSLIEQVASGDGINWSKVGIAAASGAAGGEAALYCGPVCGSMVAAGLNDVGQQWYDKGWDCIDWIQVGGAVPAGGLMGMFGSAFAPEASPAGLGVLSGITTTMTGDFGLEWLLPNANEQQQP
jgi:RHS repeat-associated protein